jgi:hypothetical protein
LAPTTVNFAQVIKSAQTDYIARITLFSQSVNSTTGLDRCLFATGACCSSSTRSVFQKKGLSVVKTKTPAKRTKTATETKTSKKATRSAAPRGSASKSADAGSRKSDVTPTVDRRMSEERRKTDRRTQQVPVAVERRKLERRVKVNRRRQIDPTTCERDYTDEELQFMSALDEYKRTSGRMFPTCSEVLEVFKGLGYEKVTVVETPSEPSSVETGGESGELAFAVTSDEAAPLMV